MDHLAGSSRQAPQATSNNFQMQGLLLSQIAAATTIAVGATLAVFPDSVLSFVFPCQLRHGQGIYDLDRMLSRLTGGILLAHGISSLILPGMMKKKRNKSDDSFAFYTAAVISQAAIGLCLVLVGLFDHNSHRDGIPKCGALQSLWLLGMGAWILVLACIAMMFSFWPKSANEQPNNNSSFQEFSQWLMTCRSSEAAIDNDDEHRYCLLEDNDNDEDEQQQQQENNNNEHQIDSECPVETNDDYHDIMNNQQSSTSRIRGTRRLLKLAAPQVFYLYVGCFVLLVRLPFSLSIPHFVSTTLGALARNDFGGARFEIALLFILGTIDAALDFWCVFLFGYANERILRSVRKDAFKSILSQEVAFFDFVTSGELASRLSSDTGEMAGDLTWFFRFSIESVVRIAGITAYMLIRSPTLATYALTIVPIVAIVNKLYGDWLSTNARQVQDALAAANSHAQQAFANVRTVIGFASETFEQEKYGTRIDEQYKLNVKQLFMTGVYYMAISTFLINTVVQAILLFVGTSFVHKGKLTVEVLLAFMLYQGQLQSQTLTLFQSYTSLIKSSGAGDRVFAILDRKPRSPGTGSPNVRDDDETTNNNHSQFISVHLKNLQFAYPSRPDRRVLRGLSLEIPQGKTVALVGSSGCGKSTVIGMLERFYDPSSGTILINGADLRCLNVKDHRRRIGVVTQDPTLFTGTIFSNITYGHPTATLDDAVRAAKLANAHDFIVAFPRGYDTEVGERGVQLSGGQKQRIAIARAVAKNPCLLLLDEATSALDAESEQVVQEALDHLLNANKDMTTIVVAHRLRTVRNADCIAYIEHGKVAELGRHDELVTRRDGKYRKMVERANHNKGELPEK